MTTEPTHVWHDVDLSGYGREYLTAQKETATLEFVATWRGRPVVLRMEANRYVHSQGWSEWRIFARQAREDTNGQGLGAELTDTARTRLRDEFSPAVEAWLKSKAYRDSESRAYVWAIQAEARELARYGSDRLRHAVRANINKVPKADATRLMRAADAYDRFDALLNNRKVTTTA